MTIGGWIELGSTKVRASGPVMAIVSRLHRECHHWAVFEGPADQMGALLADGYRGSEAAAIAATTELMRRRGGPLLRLVKA